MAKSIQRASQVSIDENTLSIEVEHIINEARRQWKLDDQWQVDWEWVKPNGKMSASESDETGWTQKRAFLKLDSRLKKEWRDKLRYEIFHELAHVIVAPIWRGMSDWADVMIIDPKEREIWETQINTRENEVIDHLVCQVFGIR